MHNQIHSQFFLLLLFYFFIFFLYMFTIITVIYLQKITQNGTSQYYLLHKTNLNEKSVLFVIVLLFWSYMEEVLP